MTRPDRSDESAFAAAIRTAHDRAQTEARRALTWQFANYRRTLRRYGWKVTEAIDGAYPLTVASGRNLTRAGRDRAWYAAYLRELNHDHRARPAAER
jgi:hypothetical protein